MELLSAHLSVRNQWLLHRFSYAMRILLSLLSCKLFNVLRYNKSYGENILTIALGSHAPQRVGLLCWLFEFPACELVTEGDYCYASSITALDD